MKVILLKDVARIGQKYEVKDVPDGHALNYLMPNKLAEPANKQNMKRLEKRREKIEAEQASAADEFKRVLDTLTENKVTITAPANEKGHLFKGLHAKEVSEALGDSITPEMVILEGAIKEVGEHTVILSMGEQRGEVTIQIDAEA